jgi:N-acetylglucosamine-6-phosphate deacetylase
MRCIYNARLILEDRILPEGWVSYGNEFIDRIGQGQPAAFDQGLDAQNQYLAPGFIDLHVHGAVGFDFLQASSEGFARAADYHLTGGTTTLCPTAATATYDEFWSVISTWNAAKGLTKCRLLPVHLEGPHLSPAKAGAQDPALMRAPTETDIKWILTRAAEISQITVAPELPGALEFIKAAAGAGIKMSAGHTEASDANMREGFAAGLSKVTHLFNAMSVASKKGLFRQAGVVEYALAEKNLSCELVADGFHVMPTLARLAYRAKGADHLALVTDALAGAGMPLGYSFRLGRLDCKVGEGYCMLADGSALAGSLARTIDLVRYMAKTVEIPLPEVIRMASLTPARILGHEQRLGSVAPNKVADFVLFDDDFVVTSVVIRGVASNERTDRGHLMKRKF